jgi:septum formation protein
MLSCAEIHRQNKAMPSPRRLVLASTSPYRAGLLQRLGLPFEQAAPGVEEAARPGESPSATATRLAILKARAVAARLADALVIGSDQVASCEGTVLGKPGDRENARRQLAFLSGKTASFDTAVALLDSASGFVRSRVVPCRVTFRTLSPQQIEAYLEREQPYDCAGSAKSEGLGIALIARIETDDPTALVGLPLVTLTDLLAQAGMPVLG